LKKELHIHPCITLQLKNIIMANQVMTDRITRSGNRTKAILSISLIAGTLDLVTAIIVYQANPIRLLQGIASGAFGREAAFSGGVLMSASGLLFHYIIATSWTTLFFLLYPKFKILSKNAVVTGLLYGVVVWTGMNLIVLPYLSLIPQRAFDLSGALIGMSILMVMIGLPVSILTQRYYSGKGLLR
jgi:hypothetical protein